MVSLCLHIRFLFEGICNEILTTILQLCSTGKIIACHIIIFIQFPIQQWKASLLIISCLHCNSGTGLVNDTCLVIFLMLHNSCKIQTIYTFRNCNRLISGYRSEIGLRSADNFAILLIKSIDITGIINYISLLILSYLGKACRLLK